MEPEPNSNSLLSLVILIDSKSAFTDLGIPCSENGKREIESIEVRLLSRINKFFASSPMM